MKLPPILTGIVLDPAAGTIDFSALDVGFDPRTVLGVLHEPTNRWLFAKGRSGLGYTSITGAVMTLTIDTTGLAAGPLTGFRDDGALIATDARLEACRALLATANATLSNLATGIGTPSDTDPGSDTAPGSILALLRRGLGRWTTLLARIPALGPAAAAGSIPVTLPADGQFTASVGLPADAAATTDTGAASLTSLTKRTLGNWTALLARVPALVSGRVPVDGSGVTQPISAAALPLPGGAATSANQASEITALGAPADGAYAGAGSSSIIAALKGVYNAILAPTSAGTNVIGKVGIDQTTAGTTNGVVVNSSALPTGAATAANQVTAIAATQALATRMVPFVESTAVLAANQTTALTTRDAGSPANYSRFNQLIFPNQAGILVTQGSNDGVTWYNTFAANISAGTANFYSQSLVFRYNRAYFTNGATANASGQSTILQSSFTTN